MTKHEQHTPQNEITPQEQATEQFLNGPRMTGEVPLGNGAHAVHAISGDGMKYTRIQGNPNKSYADWHAKKVAEADRFEDSTGIRPAGMPPRAEVVAPVGKIQRARKAARAIIDNLNGKYPS